MIFNVEVPARCTPGTLLGASFLMVGVAEGAFEGLATYSNFLSPEEPLFCPPHDMLPGIFFPSAQVRREDVQEKRLLLKGGVYPK
jgi:hypothetical protein